MSAVTESSVESDVNPTEGGTSGTTTIYGTYGIT